ncbi:D-isomer specific 2-hydroxyacid dehydrogenase, partial [Lipomyces starkeyi]
HTYHILNTETLALLPQGARVVNVGRGGLIDSEALIAAFNSRQLTSAGPNVFEDKPQIPEILLDRWDVTLSPHIGSA